jgi:5-methylcytosine-specific restriction protein A
MTRHPLKTLKPRLQTLDPSKRFGHAGTPKYSDPRRGSRHERGYGTAWDKLRLYILRRDAGICQHCRKTTGELHTGNEVDHIVPKFEGGTDDESNLQTICREAHRRKTAEEAKRGRGLG